MFWTFIYEKLEKYKFPNWVDLLPKYISIMEYQKTEQNNRISDRVDNSRPVIVVY